MADQHTGAGSSGRERRAWIAAHHPDQDGNSQAFIASLASSGWLANPEERNAVPGHRLPQPQASGHADTAGPLGPPPAPAPVIGLARRIGMATTADREG